MTYEKINRGYKSRSITNVFIQHSSPCYSRGSSSLTDILGSVDERIRSLVARRSFEIVQVESPDHETSEALAVDVLHLGGGHSIV